jgi:arylsulfatase
MNAGMTPAEQLAHSLSKLEEIGGPASYSVGPVGWAIAMDTPFPYFKTVASRLGGVTNGMVVSWPARIRERGVRGQFVDITDVMPTVLEAAGLTPPAVFNDVPQTPLHGVSFGYSFAHQDAPSRHTAQYFEIFGHAAMYQDRWFAASRVIDGPFAGYAIAAIEAPWQLYDLRTDPTQTEDVAARFPEQLAALRENFQAVAERNNVLPLSNNNLQALLPQSRPDNLAAAGRYIFYPSPFRYTDETFPSILNRSWSIDADFEMPPGGAAGVIVKQGGRFGGWGLVVLGGVPHFIYRADDRDVSLLRLAASAPLSSGRHHVVVAFTADKPGLGCGGTFRMEIDGQHTAMAHLARSVPFAFTPEGAVVGNDTGTALIDDYQVPFPYNAALHAVTFDLGPAELPSDMQRLALKLKKD